MNPASFLKSILKTMPVIKGLVMERDALIKAHGIAPPGHFYSPIASIEDVLKDEARIFGNVPHVIPGIELHEAEQLQLLQTFEKYYASALFPTHKTASMRYYYENPAYSYSDGIFLHCMIRHLQPKKIIEVGSGYSSCATLDTNEIFFDNSISTTFIEPHPELLLSLITEDDRNRIKVIPQRLQDVPLSEFQALAANDILFIDSTHVSKVGSDVNRIFSEILPSLCSGVYIHIHDIVYPFEYPKDWVLSGKSWNEVYMLRSFLQYNNRFRIVLMNTFLEHFHESYFQTKMPLCLKNRGGSIWIRKD